ncbi:family 16 glycosylhydrolase [uncultured Fluviicola sp.]|uniref:family 16 glycosylhydrolase n=1 Tax=uncultured Fluviicola sp. TaxID=463303 RepID=UPI0025F9994E|nr:family 16 glycosylhydrolase [uncultured Fluviicola sp.]
MKVLMLFLLTFFVSVSNNLFAQCFGSNIETLNITPVPCNEMDWKLYFEDNFDGSSLDPSKWILPYQGVVGGYDFNGWKNWYANTGTTPSKPISDNVVVENGNLKIIARKESTPISGTYQNWSNGGALTTSSFDYSSGWIESKKEFGYGWYEIRCKIPKGRGFWPSFWLFDEHSGVRSEIDVFEFWNESTCVFGSYNPSMLAKNPHFTIHSNHLNPGGNTNSCGYDLYGCASNGGVDYSSDYHVFALEWGFYRINWYIDGALVHTMYRYNTIDLLGGQTQPVGCNTAEEDVSYWANESWPKTDRMQVRFNFAMQYGNSNPKNQNIGFNNAPDATTPFPSAFEIDYFRYYKQNGPCIANGTLSSFPLDQEMYHNFVNQNITVTNQVVPSNYVVDITTTTSVVLNPGFEAVNGSYFLAHINPNICNTTPALVVNSENQERIADNFSENAIQENSSLDVNDLSADSDVLKVYPNPTSDHLMIELTSGGINSIEITDSQGRSLLSDSRELNEAMNLDVSSFSPGTYFIKILNKQSGKVYLERFTKNK